jgi:hypothetical protein
LKPLLIVENFFRKTSLPTVTLPVSSMLYDFLKGEHADDVVSKYDLGPFDISVQTLQLTFVDKLYALNSYHMRNRIEARSRHLYDLHKILPHIKFDKEFFGLLRELGEYERNEFARSGNFADFDPSNLTEYLRGIISRNAYRDDYESNTLPLLFRKVPYEDTVHSLGYALSRIDDMEEGEFMIDVIAELRISPCRRTAKV